MSSSTEPGAYLDTPFADVPDADDPRRGKEVFAPTEGPFEVPAKEFVPGPYYANVEEKLPAVAERPASAAASGAAAAATAAATFPVDRRNFMKLFSASTVAATTACVQRPVEMAIPFVQQPIDTVPGVPVWYASTCGACATGCGVMVKTREGRPRKIEGLPDHPISNGRLCPIGQAAPQALYHPERRKGPMIRFADRLDQVKWNDVYEHLGARLAKGQRIAILTRGDNGSRPAFFREWLTAVGSSPERLYLFDSNQQIEATTAAHKLAYGVDAMPRADLHQAQLIVGIGADFLDVGTNKVYNTKAYTEMHAFKNGRKGRHVQFESDYTLTGGRADERLVIPPGSETLTTLLLVRSLFDDKSSKGSAASRGQIQQVLEQKADVIAAGYDRVGVPRAAFDKLAGEMLAVPSVVMAGGLTFDENTTVHQIAAIMANELVGAYDTILQLGKGWMPAQVQTGDLQRFIADAPNLDAVFVIDTNPVFSLPATWGMADVLKKIPTVVSIQDFPNEVDPLAHYVLNGHHWLEAWGDAQPVAGFWSARQPTVRSTTDSRQAEDVLLWLAATLKKPMGHEDYRSYLRQKWQAVAAMTGNSTSDADQFFNAVLHQGFAGKVATQAIGDLSADLAANFKYTDTARGGLRLLAPLDFRLHAGEFAHLPVLQEAAQTMTTITWDTPVCLNPNTCAKLGIRKYDVVTVEGPAGSFKGSVYPLPGLHPDAVVVARGNGHALGTGTIEGGNGINPLVALAKAVDALTGSPVTGGQPVKLTLTGEIFPLAQLQKHNDIANREDIVKKVSLKEALARQQHTKDLDKAPDLYPPLPKLEYRWGMAIDLSRCSGCQACYVACSVENNVPQVGREQVLLGREMHWIKIDRYFYGPVDTPQVSFQPMLCQHCQHAPCEPVCPVFATTHDPEGINTMTYNRCIGTRYCANACPYKIRRFNWWTHKWNVMGERLQDRNPVALNPDVTVRTRGVMEKCSFCYQRVRDARHTAKIRGTPVTDTDVKVACQQTCPTDAITFGNLNDPASAVAKLRQDNRSYLALGGDPEHGHYGIKTLPNVSYLAEVTLAEPDTGAAHHPGGAKPEH